MSYIKLHRQIQESEIWGLDTFSRGQAWIDLLLLASHNDYTTIIKNQPVKLHRGDLVASKRFLMKRWKWGSSKTLAYLDLLSKLKMLSKIRPGNGPDTGSVYHITNYDTYQSWESDSQTGSQTAIRPVADRLQTETKNQEEPKEPKRKSIAAGSNGTNGHRDEAYETFAERFELERHTPYRHQRADFIQLASLRKALGTESKAAPAGWGNVVDNYLASPLGRYTMADACSRYDVFLAGPVDRFGKPEVESTEKYLERLRRKA